MDNIAHRHKNSYMSKCTDKEVNKQTQQTKSVNKQATKTQHRAKQKKDHNRFTYILTVVQT